ncbi:hypothetical protein NP493_3g04019 [Ridgeia piscesae]|uniref:Uncharacterized protein n=1 Tax=Ridgeia piscesae TaxID=27915 RepID=A0AAD9PG06_RIDPI|nr:hypothetical protein NP493_3g04019 [Ridgeia piscesae]
MAVKVMSSRSFIFSGRPLMGQRTLSSCFLRSVGLALGARLGTQKLGSCFALSLAMFDTLTVPLDPATSASSLLAPIFQWFSNFSSCPAASVRTKSSESFSSFTFCFSNSFIFFEFSRFFVSMYSSIASLS